MTIDKQKLKALAEAATQSHGARQVEIDHNGVHVIGDGSWKILSAWHTPDGKGAQNAEFVAAASPATVLTLLAEIDGLHDQHGRDSGELRKLCNARDSARRERDQLKAENEDYKSGQERYEQIIEDLKAEIEALRKDAELLALGRAKLAGAMSRLRAKHNDWTAPEALPAAELVWCACGDGFPPNSYGAGFMDANNGICWSCDAAKAVSHD